MKNLPVIALLLIWQISFAQTREHYGLLSYIPPEGWTKGTTQTTTNYTHTDAKKNAWCQLIIYEATAGKGSPDADFASEWKELVLTQYPAAGQPQKNGVRSENEWTLVRGSTVVTSRNEKLTIVLTTLSGNNTCLSVLARTTHPDYVKDIESFTRTFQFLRPGALTADPKAPSAPGVYTFTTSNFDDGWTSTVQPAYVLVQKGSHSVYLNYSVPYNASQFSGTGTRDAEFYWDTYVTKQFDVKTKQFNDGSSMALKPPYLEGYAIDKRTGASCFIGMYLLIVPNAANVVIGTAPDETTFRRLFPKANDPFGSDLAAMTRYNKFAVASNDLTGKWQNGNTETAHWYYVSPAGYEGYAGMTVAATSATFIFNPDGTYISIHNGASGAVGSMNTFQQEFKGTYTTNPWTITATNRYGGKTDRFDASFVAVRGGRILTLNNGAGQVYNLVRSR